MTFVKIRISDCFHILLTILFALICNHSYAQQKNQNFEFERKFEGSWYNKTTKRHISISFEKGIDYATINDWIAVPKAGEIDAYKAYIENDKLILYAENEDHHAPYCEMEIKNQKLIYRCNGALNFKDQFLNLQKTIDETVFERKE